MGYPVRASKLHNSFQASALHCSRGFVTGDPTAVAWIASAAVKNVIGLTPFSLYVGYLWPSTWASQRPVSPLDEYTKLWTVYKHRVDNWSASDNLTVNGPYNGVTDMTGDGDCPTMSGYTGTPYNTVTPGTSGRWTAFDGNIPPTTYIGANYAHTAYGTDQMSPTAVSDTTRSYRYSDAYSWESLDQTLSLPMNLAPKYSALVSALTGVSWAANSTSRFQVTFRGWADNGGIWGGVPGLDTNGLDPGSFADGSGVVSSSATVWTAGTPGSGWWITDVSNGDSPMRRIYGQRSHIRVQATKAVRYYLYRQQYSGWPFVGPLSSYSGNLDWSASEFNTRQWVERYELLSTGVLFPDPATGYAYVEVPMVDTTPFPIRSIGGMPVLGAQNMMVFGSATKPQIGDKFWNYPDTYTYEDVIYYPSTSDSTGSTSDDSGSTSDGG